MGMVFDELQDVGSLETVAQVPEMKQNRLNERLCGHSALKFDNHLVCSFDLCLISLKDSLHFRLIQIAKLVKSCKEPG